MGVNSKISKPKPKYYDENIIDKNPSKSSSKFAVFVIACIIIGASVSGLLIANSRNNTSSENSNSNGNLNGIKDGDKIKFGHHHIKVFNLPGHTAESLITIIDRQFLHIGDLLIMNNAGKYYLPLVGIEQDSLENYIESLKKLQEYSFSTVILGHGPVLMGKNQINESIERNLYYLTKLKEIGANAEISMCVKGNLDEYIHVNEYHQQNLNNITKH